MDKFEVTINEGRHRATYKYPQLIGVEIVGESIELRFDPVHSDKQRLTYARDELVSLKLSSR